jgi:hypothetical protein
MQLVQTNDDPDIRQAALCQLNFPIHPDPIQQSCHSLLIIAFEFQLFLYSLLCLFKSEIPAF